MAAADDRAESRGESELDRMAFSLFRETVPGIMGRISPETLVVNCYQNAKVFLETREKIRAGTFEIDKPIGPQLSDVSAPNLPDTHPHNLVSKEFGNLAEVERIHAHLRHNPMAEEYNVGQYRWNKTEVALARIIFPFYVKQPAKAAAA